MRTLLALLAVVAALVVFAFKPGGAPQGGLAPVARIAVPLERLEPQPPRSLPVPDGRHEDAKIEFLTDEQSESGNVSTQKRSHGARSAEAGRAVVRPGAAKRPASGSNKTPAYLQPWARDVFNQN